MKSPHNVLPLNWHARTILVCCLFLPLTAPTAQPAQSDMQHMHMDHSAPGLHGNPVAVGDLIISNVWARAPVPAVKVGAAYFTVENRGAQADTLIGANCPAASEAMFHRTTEENGVSHMAPAGKIAIPAGKTVKIEPGGLHLMLMGLKQPLHAGSVVPLTLKFEHAGEVLVQVHVVALSAPAPAADADHGSMQHDHPQH